MRDRREKILADPEAHRQEQITRQLPEDFEDWTEEEQGELLDYLEGVVMSADPSRFRRYAVS